MSFNARLLPSDVELHSSSAETGIIIKDIVPRSVFDDEEDNFDCFCTCSVCPSVSSWCVKDAFGLTCSFFTWFLFLYGQFVIVFVILLPSSYSWAFISIHLLIFHSLAFLAISSHCRTMFSNPGTVPLNNATPEKLFEYENGTVVYRCTKCQSIKPPRAHHCRVCQRCINRMDHHCVFVNNCVGQNNQKYFILFTVYTFLVSIHGLYLASNHLFTCIASHWTACPAWSSIATLVFSILLILEAVTFAIFTVVMTSTQLYSIYTDTTGIELLKNKPHSHRQRHHFISSLKVVFGSNVSLAWFNPFSKPIDLITQDDEHIRFDV